MAASGSDAVKGRGKWTLVDGEGNIQGSDSDTGSSSDCVAVGDSAVLYRSKRSNSRTSSLSGSPKNAYAEHPQTDQPENASSSAAWLGNIWTVGSSQAADPAATGQRGAPEGCPATLHRDEEDDVDTDSMESIEVIPMPSDGQSEEEEEDGIGSMTLDPSSSSTWPQTGSASVHPLSSTDALSPFQGVSPTCSHVEEISSSSNSSQLGFLLVDQAVKGSQRGSPAPQSFEEVERRVGGVAGGDEKTSNPLHDDDDDSGERAFGRAGNLPMMPRGELPLSSVSVDDIPRGVDAGGSPRRAHSTGSLPKESNNASVGAPIMTQRWPTEDGGFLLVQQFRGDGEPAVAPGDAESALSRSSSFSDLSSSFSYPGVRRRIPETSASRLRHQSSDASSEDQEGSSPYGETSNDELPANMTMSRVTPGIRQYLHRRDERLNSKLTMAALLVVTAAVALVVGHYIGSSQATTHHLGIEAGQVWRLRSLQDQLVTCLDKTKALLKGSKGANGKPPNLTIMSDSRPVPPSPVKFVLEDAQDQPSSNQDSVSSCSMCADSDHPGTRYSQFCNTECKELGSDSNTPAGIETNPWSDTAHDEDHESPDSRPATSQVGGSEEDNEVDSEPFAEWFSQDNDKPSIERNLDESMDAREYSVRADWLETRSKSFEDEGDKVARLVVEDGDILIIESEKGQEEDASSASYEFDEELEDEQSLPPLQFSESLPEMSDNFESKNGECIGSEDDLTNGQTDYERCEEKKEGEGVMEEEADQKEKKQEEGMVEEEAELEEEEAELEEEEADEHCCSDSPDALEEENPAHRFEHALEEEHPSHSFEGSNGMEDEDLGEDPNKDEPLIWKLSSKINNSWLAFRNLTSDLVGSASNLSVNNVTTQLKENVESLRHQIKDAVSSLQKTNITSNMRDNAQTIGDHLKDAVNYIGNGSFSSVVEEAVDGIGKQIAGAVTGIKQSNVTSHVKQGLEDIQKSAQNLGEHLKDAVANVSNSSISSAVKGAVQEIGEQISGVVTQIKQSNITHHVKQGLREFGNTLRKAASSKKGNKAKKPRGKGKKNKKEKRKAKIDKKHDNGRKQKGKHGDKRKHHKKGKPHKSEKMKNVHSKKSNQRPTSEPDAEKIKKKTPKRNEKMNKKQKHSHLEEGTQKGNSVENHKHEGSWTTEQDTHVERSDRKAGKIKEQNKIFEKESKSKHKKNKDSKKNKEFETSDEQEISSEFSRKEDRSHRNKKESKSKHKKNKHSKKNKEFETSDGQKVGSEFSSKGDRSHRNKKEKKTKDQPKEPGMKTNFEYVSQHGDRNRNDRRETDAHGNTQEKGLFDYLKDSQRNEYKGTKERNKDRFQSADLDELFENFDVRCHGVHDCLRKQREAALKLYQELLDYQDWLTERCYKKHLEELEDFMEELEEFLAEPSVTDRDLMELMEDFEDMAEDLEEATTKSFRNFMKKGWSFSNQKPAGKQTSQEPLEDADSEDEEMLTVTFDFLRIFNLSQNSGDKGSSNGESGEPKEERKHAGYGFQSNDDWFMRRMHDREDLRHKHEMDNLETDPSNNNGDWYERWMKGREEERSKMTVWDLYQWFSKRQALRHEWRLHEMDDQSNWFLRRP